MVAAKSKDNKKTNENPLVFSFLNWFENERGKTKKSVAAYQWELYRFVSYLVATGIHIQNCSKTNIRSFLASLPKENSPSSRARTLFCIKTFFKYLTREGFIPLNPADAIDSPKLSHKVPHFLNQEEYRRLIKQSSSRVNKNSLKETFFEILNINPPTIYSVILALLGNGIAKEKIPILLKLSFNKQKGTIKIPDLKKTIFMHPKSVHIITNWLNNRHDSSPYLLVQEGNKMPIKSKSLSPKDCIRMLALPSKQRSLMNSYLNSFNKNANLRNLAILALLLGTGIRRSELVGLDKKDFNYTQKTIQIVRKGGDQQIVELGSEVVEALKSYLSTRTDKLTPMFLSKFRQRLSPEGLWLIVKKLLKEAGLEGSTHTLRHSFVTELIRQGVPIAVVQSVVGHKNIQTTLHYTHIMSEDRKKAVSQIKLGLSKKHNK